MSLSDGATAVDYFTYTVRDQSGNTSNGQLAITVTGINEAPTSTAPPTIRAVEDQPIKFQTKILQIK